MFPMNANGESPCYPLGVFPSLLFYFNVHSSPIPSHKVVYEEGDTGPAMHPGSRVDDLWTDGARVSVWTFTALVSGLVLLPAVILSFSSLDGVTVPRSSLQYRPGGPLSLVLDTPRGSAAST